MSRTDLHDQNLLKVIPYWKRKTKLFIFIATTKIHRLGETCSLNKKRRKERCQFRQMISYRPTQDTPGWATPHKKTPAPPCTTPHDHPTHWETPAISPTWDDHKIGQNSKHTNQWFTTEQLVVCRLSNTITQRQHANFLTSPILIKMGLGLRGGLPEPQIWDRPQAPPPVGTAENRQHQEVDFLGCWVTQRPRMRALTTKDPTQVSTASHNA